MDNFAFGYFPKMLKTWRLLLVVKNAQPKSIANLFIHFFEK